MKNHQEHTEIKLLGLQPLHGSKVVDELLLSLERQSTNKAMERGDSDEYNKPLLEDLINVNVVSPSIHNNTNSKDSDDIILDISELESSSPQATTASRHEWCSEWGFHDLPPLPTFSPVDPFRSESYYVTGVWEWVKMVICVPVLVVRLLLLLLMLAFGYVFTKAALFGWERGPRPMARWRRFFMAGTRACGRGILFSFGFHWIKRVGKPAARDVAPIIVSNHVSFIDPIFYFYEFFPTIVSSSSHNDMRFVGTIIRAMQVIIVDRLSAESRREAVNEIKRRAASNEFPPVLLFPEGTTTNGRALISFKPGAFVPGFPVQPVVVKYPHVHFDVSWGNISLVSLLPRMLLQLHNFMQVHYLPVVYPSEHEKSHPREFAERVRDTMARSLNVPATEHTYGDSELCSRALELKLSPSTVVVLEMGKVMKQLQVTNSDALFFLEKFASMNTSRSGILTKSEFLKSLGLSNDSFGSQVFSFFDRGRRNFVNFQEFVAASVTLSRHFDFGRLVETTFQLLDTDKDNVVLLDEVDKALQSTFRSLATERLLSKVFGDKVTHLELATFQLHLSKNPELLFPLSLAVKNRLLALEQLY